MPAKVTKSFKVASNSLLVTYVAFVSIVHYVQSKVSIIERTHPPERGTLFLALLCVLIRMAMLIVVALMMMMS